VVCLEKWSDLWFDCVMDSLTQLLLGAGVGYVIAGRQLGRRALALGAFAGTLPDLDSIPLSLFNDDYLMLKHHRGITHSLVFCVFFSFVMAYGSRLYSKLCSFSRYYWFYFWCFLTHTLIDCFTTWGTQLFWPLAPRIAFNSVFIIDPIYTIWLLLAMILCLVRPVSRFRLRIMSGALIVSSLYLCVTLGLKWKMNDMFDAYFKHHGITYTKMMSRPTPFNTVLWSATVKTDTGYYVGLRSFLDKSNEEEPLFIKNHPVDESLFQDDRSNFIRFVTHGFYVATPSENGLDIHDLRFGSMASFVNTAPRYLFTYHLTRDTLHQKTLVSSKNPDISNTGELFRRLFQRLKGV